MTTMELCKSNLSKMNLMIFFLLMLLLGFVGVRDILGSGCLSGGGRTHGRRLVRDW